MKLQQSEIKKQLKELYRKFPEARGFLKTLGCDRNTAEDIFQEALVIYIRRLEDPSFTLTVEPYFYVRNTCKLLWYNQSRKNGKTPSFQLEKDVADQQDDWMEKEIQLGIVEKAMQKLGDQCRQILQLFYGAGMAMSDIAKKVGLRNDKVVKAQKYRCLQKAKEHARDLKVETPQNSLL